MAQNQNITENNYKQYEVFVHMDGVLKLWAKDEDEATEIAETDDDADIEWTGVEVDEIKRIKYIGDRD
jgi:hypothetical protein